MGIVRVKAFLASVSSSSMATRHRFCYGKDKPRRDPVVKVTEFDRVWKCSKSRRGGKSRCASFYKPVGIPQGFHCLGHYCQQNNQPLRGFVLAARANDPDKNDHRPALKKPVNYTLVWSQIQTATSGCLTLPLVTEPWESSSQTKRRSLAPKK
ncbi:Vacuolar protein sorting-associated protein 62 protein [Raphanus sativus]|nr:Vacuolar protein sorting-associated protein 62 protein [Raphanus sativus]